MHSPKTAHQTPPPVTARSGKKFWKHVEAFAWAQPLGWGGSTLRAWLWAQRCRARSPIELISSRRNAFSAQIYPVLLRWQASPALPATLSRRGFSNTEKTTRRVDLEITHLVKWTPRWAQRSSQKKPTQIKCSFYTSGLRLEKLNTSEGSARHSVFLSLLVLCVCVFGAPVNCSRQLRSVLQPPAFLSASSLSSPLT